MADKECKCSSVSFPSEEAYERFLHENSVQVAVNEEDSGLAVARKTQEAILEHYDFPSFDSYLKSIKIAGDYHHNTLEAYHFLKSQLVVGEADACQPTKGPPIKFTVPKAAAEYDKDIKVMFPADGTYVVKSNRVEPPLEALNEEEIYEQQIRLGFGEEIDREVFKCIWKKAEARLLKSEKK